MMNLRILIAVVLLPGLLLGGFMLGVGYSAQNYRVELAELRSVVDEYRGQQQALRSDRQLQLEFLAMEIGKLKASSMRLEALGDRLVSDYELDAAEFDFSQPAPVGGQEIYLGEQQSLASLLEKAALLQREQAADRQLLSYIEAYLLEKQDHESRRPSWWPTEGGWVSSLFGMRDDPFSGKQSFHKGIDIAAAEGSSIYAVASGIVTRVERGSGYGKLLEVRHGDGLVTRYAHCKEILVAAGDSVKKGQALALVGSTGRSTGPHVHVEFEQNGKLINPLKILKKPRRS